MILNRNVKTLFEGREEVSDEVHVGRPLTTAIDENVVYVRELLKTNRWSSFCSVSRILNIHKKYRSQDCDEKFVVVKLLSNVLTDDQRSHGLETCQERSNHCPAIIQSWLGSRELFSSDWTTLTEGSEFRTVDKVDEACTRTLKDIPEEAYRDVFDARKSRWKRCTVAGGLHMETFPRV